MIGKLFEMFESYLRDQGLEARGEQIINATLAPAPKQRNSRQDSKVIKAKRLPAGLNESLKRMPQRDLDARWFKNKISISIVTRTAFALMLCMFLSHALFLTLHVFTIVR